MIHVTKLNGKDMVLNCELIQTVEANPDTTIMMTTGLKVIVLESVDDIIDKTIFYKREIRKQA